MLDAFASHDVAFMRSIPEAQLQSGNSECKNWIAVAGACSGLQFHEVDYVPGFRTAAGTGTGLEQYDLPESAAPRQHQRMSGLIPG